MQSLESVGRLDREIEYLPNAEEIAERVANEQGLRRPETGGARLLQQDDDVRRAPGEPRCRRIPRSRGVLLEYFPTALREDFADAIRGHRLRPRDRRDGPDQRVRQPPGADVRVPHGTGARHGPGRRPPARSTIVRDAFRMPALWHAIESLDNRVPAEIQYRMQILVRGLVERATHWLLRSRRPTEGDRRDDRERFRPGARRAGRGDAGLPRRPRSARRSTSASPSSPGRACPTISPWPSPVSCRSPPRSTSSRSPRSLGRPVAATGRGLLRARAPPRADLATRSHRRAPRELPLARARHQRAPERPAPPTAPSRPPRSPARRRTRMPPPHG